MLKRFALVMLCLTVLAGSRALWSEDTSKSSAAASKSDSKKESRTERMIQMMKDKLKLEAGQVDKIKKIVGDEEKASEPTRAEMKKLAVQLNELRHKIKKGKEQSADKIREVLTPEQRLEFDKMQQHGGRRPGMNKGGRGPGGKMGPEGQMGQGGPMGQGGQMGQGGPGGQMMHPGGEEGGEGEEMPEQPMEEGEAE